MGEKTNIYDLGNGVCIFCEFERAEEWCNNCATWLCRDCRRNSHSTLDERNHDVTSLDDVIQYQGVWHKICAKTTWNHLNEGRHLQKLDKILQFVQDDVEKGTEHITQQRARVSASWHHCSKFTRLATRKTAKALQKTASCARSLLAARRNSRSSSSRSFFPG